MLIQARRTTPGRTALAGLAVIAILALSACGAGEASSGTSGTTDSSAVREASARAAADMREVTNFPQVQPVDGAAGLKGKTVWYVPIGAAVPILTAMGAGIDEALANLGVDVHTCDGKFVPTSIAACLDQAASNHADAVVTGYVDYGLLPNAFDALADKGIPVLLAGAIPSPDRAADEQLAYDDTTADQKKNQESTADQVIADSDGKADIIFLAPTDSPALTSTADYALEYYGDKCPGCSVIRVDYQTAALNKLGSQVSAKLIQNPDVHYVVGLVDASAAPAITGIQSAGRAKDVKYAATNGDLDALQRIKDGQIQFADAGSSPSYLGWRFADGIVRMMTGTEPSTTGAVLRLFTADNVGALDLTPDAYATNAWYGGEEYKDLFLKAWGAS